MTILQRQAWYQLAICAAVLLTLAALLPFVGPARAWGAFGLMGLLGLPRVTRRARAGAFLLDERDRSIQDRAVTLGLSVFWMSFILAALGTWGVVSYGLHRDVVPVGVLPFAVFGGWLLFTVCHASAILVQYGTEPAQ